MCLILPLPLLLFEIYLTLKASQHCVLTAGKYCVYVDIIEPTDLRPSDRHVGCFQFPTITKSSGINDPVHVL